VHNDTSKAYYFSSCSDLQRGDFTYTLILSRHFSSFFLRISRKAILCTQRHVKRGVQRCSKGPFFDSKEITPVISPCAPPRDVTSRPPSRLSTPLPPQSILMHFLVIFVRASGEAILDTQGCCSMHFLINLFAPPARRF